MIYIDCVNHYFVTNEPIYYYYTPLLQRFAILANMEEMKEVGVRTPFYNNSVVHVLLNFTSICYKIQRSYNQDKRKHTK